MKDRVDARTRVRVSVEQAFHVFTTEIDAWWKRGPRFRFGDHDGELELEPHVDGRFFERFTDGEVRVVGRVLVWEPPTRLVLAWSPSERGGGPHSEVEVRFSAVDGATEVHVQHRGLESRPRDDAKGLRSTALRNILAVWWADLLVRFAGHHP